MAESEQAPKSEFPSASTEKIEKEANTTENAAYTQTSYREKKRLLWHEKTCMSLIYVLLSVLRNLDLAPLTTVGNLVIYLQDYLTCLLTN